MPSLERTKTDLVLQGFHSRISNAQTLHGLGEIAAYLRCSISTVRAYIKKRGLPAAMLSKQTGYFITLPMIEQWIAEQHLSLVEKYNWDKLPQS